MRIIIVQKNFHPNSIGMLKGLLERSHTVMNIVQYDGGVKTGAGSVDVETKVVSYGTLSLRLLGRNLKRLDRRGFPRLRPTLHALRDFRPDVVIAKETRTAALATAALGKLFGAVPVLMQDKPKDRKKAPMLALIGGLFLPRRKFHMGHRGVIGEDLELGLLLGRSRLLPYPVIPGPGASGRAGQTSENEPVRILSIGSFGNRRKRQGMLVDAVAASGVADRIHLTFVGLGDPDAPGLVELREREQHHGASASEVWTNVPYEELQTRIPSFDLFVLPSRNEPFSVVIPEAMAQGLPVICSDTNGARVCFEKGISGFVFPTDSAGELGRILRVLVEDRERLSRMGVAAHERVVRALTPERWAEGFEDLVR